METFSALLALCAGNSPVPVNSPHKGQWRGALMFYFICVWINDWANNREACDLRHHRGHYDVNVMSGVARGGKVMNASTYLFHMFIKWISFNIWRGTLSNAGSCTYDHPGGINCSTTKNDVRLKATTALIRAKLFIRNINIYQQFLSFLHTYMTQVVETLPHVRQGPTYHCSQYYGCWCPGDARSQGISSNDIIQSKPG